jgi:hypothetical protein
MLQTYWRKTTAGFEMGDEHDFCRITCQAKEVFLNAALTANGNTEIIP